MTESGIKPRFKSGVKSRLKSGFKSRIKSGFKFVFKSGIKSIFKSGVKSGNKSGISYMNIGDQVRDRLVLQPLQEVDYVVCNTTMLITRLEATLYIRAPLERRIHIHSPFFESRGIDDEHQ